MDRFFSTVALFENGNPVDSILNTDALYVFPDNPDNFAAALLWLSVR